MPRSRVSDLSQRSRNAVRQQITENQLNEEDRVIAREERRVNMAQRRATLTPEERDAARETARLAMRNRRAFLRDQQRFARRNIPRVDLKLAAFQYDSTMNYSSHPSVDIGPMEIVCDHCGALKFAGETPGLCCLSGKVKLPIFTPPPEPLNSLLSGETLLGGTKFAGSASIC